MEKICSGRSIHTILCPVHILAFDNASLKIFLAVTFEVFCQQDNDLSWEPPPPSWCVLGIFSLLTLTFPPRLVCVAGDVTRGYLTGECAWGV